MELQNYGDFEFIEDNHNLFTFRCKIEDAMAVLRNFKAKLDEQLILKMTEQDIAEFETGPEDNRTLVKRTKEKKDKLKDTKRLRKMLLTGTQPERELAERALAGGQSAWKIPKVREMADTLGVSQDEFVETTWTDKVIVKALPVDILAAKGIKVGSKKPQLEEPK